MTQPTLAQTRVVDPVLTEVARGYTSQKAAAAQALFPIVSVAKAAGRIIKFGPDAFKLVSTARAPGANTNRVQTGYSNETFSLVEHRLEALVPREMIREAAGTPGIDVVAMNIRMVQDRMALEREKQAADLATNAANFTNKKTAWGTAGRRVWSDYGNSDPFSDIMDARNAIRSATGEKPNTLVLGPTVLTALRSHPKVLDRMSTAADRPPATLAQLQALFEVDSVVEAGAVYHNGTTLADVWGKNAVLAFTTPASVQQMGSPSFGYTYQLENHPFVEEGYEDRNAASWVYPVSDAYQPVLAGETAGYLFAGAVA